MTLSRVKKPTVGSIVNKAASDENHESQSTGLDNPGEEEEPLIDPQVLCRLKFS